MARLTAAPIYDPMIEGNEGKARLSWTLFFNNLIQGDVGTLWTPVPTSLTIVGSPVFIGSYWINQGWCDFQIEINPNGGTTTSTAGTTYFDLPFDALGNSYCFAVAGTTGSASGKVDALTNRVYTPAWATVSTVLTVCGRVKV